MDKHSLFMSTLALATLCPGTPALAEEPAGHHLPPGIQVVADSELAGMRGRYIAGDDTVLWFGVEMASTWQTDTGHTLQSALTLGMDFSQNPNRPQVSFVPTVTITTTGHALPAPAASGPNRSVQSAGLANVSGMLQSVQIAGDDNAASNVARLSIRSAASSDHAIAEAATKGADSLIVRAGDASAAASYSNDSAEVALSVNCQGSASQWIRPGSLGQTIVLTGDNQVVTNQMIVSMVTQSNSTTTSPLTYHLAQTLGMIHGNR